MTESIDSNIKMFNSVGSKVHSISQITHDFQDHSEDEDTENAVPPMNCLTYLDESHHTKMLTSLNTMRKSRTFCDVILHVGNMELYGHRSVLASVSPQLFELFTVEAEAESKGNVRENIITYKVNGYDSYAFEKIVEYIYTGVLECPGDKVKTVYLTALELKMEKAAKECARHLVDHITIDNAIEIRSLPGIANKKAFVIKIDQFICDNFESIKLTQALLTLPCLRVDILHQAKEEMAMVKCDALCHLVVQWVKHNDVTLEQNENTMEKLVAKVHLLYLALDNSLRDCSTLPEDASKSELVQDYKKLSLQDTQNKTKPRKKESMQPAKPRVLVYSKRNINRSDQEREYDWTLIASENSGVHQFLALAMLKGKLATLAIRLKLDIGSAESPQYSSENISPSAPEMYYPLSNLNVGRCAFGCATLQDSLLICGGYDKHACLTDAEAYIPYSNSYKQLSPLLSPRGRFNLAVVGTQAYAVGGCNGSTELASVDRYDSLKEKWIQSVPLPLARSNAGVCQLNGKIYCIGGWNGNAGIKQCDVFDPVTEKWNSIAPLNYGRSQAGVCALNGIICAVGGCDSWNCLGSVELYDPKSNTWSIASNALVNKRGCAAVAFQDSLFVIGGSDGPRSLDTTEIYDMRSEKWNVGPTMTVARANCGAAVINDQLYAIGGYSGTSFLCTLEYLDCNTQKWTSYVTNITPNGDQISDTIETESNCRVIRNGRKLSPDLPDM